VTAPSLAALRAALERAGESLRALTEPAPPASFDPRAARSLRITGVGSSAAHARYLAALLSETLGLPARFVPLDAFPLTPDPRDVLVVFSQALSPNARLALVDSAGWLAALLITAAGASRDAERRSTLEQLRRNGVTVIASAGADEFGTLLRLEGPLAGYVGAFQLARSLGLPPGTELARAPAAYAEALQRAEPLAQRLAPRLAGEPLLLLASGVYREATDNLRLKLVEGLLRPVPPIADPIEFAHGPFQALAAGRATLLALTRPDAVHEGERLMRLREMLDPERQELVQLSATLPGFAAIFEHEAWVGALLLAAMEYAGIDPARWPGRGADAPIYALQAEIRAAPPRRRSALAPLASLTWPELEQAIAGGARLALLPLGATEQHGAHLPLATDHWIADALAERVCARLAGSVRLAALALGASSEHLSFPGTLSLREDTFAAVVTDLARSLARHGFAEIFCFSAHGGNLALLRERASDFAEAARPARWIACTDHARLEARLFALAEKHGVSAAAAGHHAGELEASIVAGLRPGALRRGALAAGLLETPADVSSIFYPDLRAHAPSGTVGDPRAASPDRAALYLDAWADELVTAYEGAKKRHQT
jgi:creatinine amidohydrolase/Fe(II)-dependent formamide hydrolase-like protein